MKRKMRIGFLASLTLVLISNLHCGKSTGLPPGLDSDAVLPPAPYSGRYLAKQRAATAARAASVVFLNFGGGTINKTSSYADDSQGNTSFLPVGNSATVPPFDASPLKIDNASAIQQLLVFLNKEYAAYNVTFMDVRPASGSYKMMMIGGHASDIGYGANYAGLSPLDFGNVNPNDVGFVFAGMLLEDNYSLQSLGYCISHETGHTFGLQHISPTNDIMNPTLESGALIWGNGPLSAGSGSQDDAALLLANLGARPTAAPPNFSGILNPSPTPVASVKPSPIAIPTPAPVPTPDSITTEVTGWYVKYLGRNPDTGGLKTFGDELRAGQSPRSVLSSILGADEYFAKAGGRYTGFLQKLYRDIKGQAAPASWVTQNLQTLKLQPTSQGRTAVAYRLLTK